MQENHVDIILTDVNMPNMNGYQLATTVRELSRTIPIIGVTANAIAEEKQRCIDAGMNDCVSKPVSLTVLKTYYSPMWHNPTVNLGKARFFMVDLIEKFRYYSDKYCC